MSTPTELKCTSQYCQWHSLYEQERQKCNKLAAANVVLRQAQQYLVDKCSAISSTSTQRITELESLVSHRHDATEEVLQLREHLQQMQALTTKLDVREEENRTLRDELRQATEINRVLVDQVEVLQGAMERLTALEEGRRREERESSVASSTHRHKDPVQHDTIMYKSVFPMMEALQELDSVTKRTAKPQQSRMDSESSPVEENQHLQFLSTSLTNVKIERARMGLELLFQATLSRKMDWQVIGQQRQYPRLEYLLKGYQNILKDEQTADINIVTKRIQSALQQASVALTQTADRAETGGSITKDEMQNLFNKVLSLEAQNNQLRNEVHLLESETQGRMEARMALETNASREWEERAVQIANQAQELRNAALHRQLKAPRASRGIMTDAETTPTEVQPVPLSLVNASSEDKGSTELSRGADIPEPHSLTTTFFTKGQTLPPRTSQWNKAEPVAIPSRSIPQPFIKKDPKSWIKEQPSNVESRRIDTGKSLSERAAMFEQAAKIEASPPPPPPPESPENVSPKVTESDEQIEDIPPIPPKPFAPSSGVDAVEAPAPAQPKKLQLLKIPPKPSVSETPATDDTAPSAPAPPAPKKLQLLKVPPKPSALPESIATGSQNSPSRGLLSSVTNSVLGLFSRGKSESPKEEEFGEEAGNEEEIPPPPEDSPAPSPAASPRHEVSKPELPAENAIPEESVNNVEDVPPEAPAPSQPKKLMLLKIPPKPSAPSSSGVDAVEAPAPAQPKKLQLLKIPPKPSVSETPATDDTAPSAPAPPAPKKLQLLKVPPKPSAPGTGAPKKLVLLKKPPGAA